MPVSSPPATLQISSLQRPRSQNSIHHKSHSSIPANNKYTVAQKQGTSSDYGVALFLLVILPPWTLTFLVLAPWLRKILRGPFNLIALLLILQTSPERWLHRKTRTQAKASLPRADILCAQESRQSNLPPYTFDLRWRISRNCATIWHQTTQFLARERCWWRTWSKRRERILWQSGVRGT